MTAQFSYFTTSDDLREIVKQVDANTQFQYIEYKNFSESEYPNARMYDSLLEYPRGARRPWRAPRRRGRPFRSAGRG